MASNFKTASASPVSGRKNRLSDPADRGKTAEKDVRTYLEKLALHKDYVWHRFPDARSGSRAEAPADFMLLVRKKLVLLEVKEVAHDYRLPHDNFDTGQIARMTRFQMAGATAYVFVLHSTTGMWRAAPVSRFANREGGSWDLSDLPACSLETVFGFVV